MRRTFWLPIVVALLPATGRAQEADDALARDLAAIAADRLASPWSRIEAVQTLGKLGPRAGAAVPELTRQLLRSPGPDVAPVHEAIVVALGRMGATARPAIPTMTKVVGRDPDLDRLIRRSTEQILAAGEDASVTTLVQQLRNRDAGQRVRAAKGLALLGADAQVAVPELQTHLDDPDGDVRRMVLGAIRAIRGTLRPAEILGVAVLDLQSPDEDVRFRAAREIGRLGRDGASARQALQPLLTDRNPDVRRAAAEAVGRITPP